MRTPPPEQHCLAGDRHGRGSTGMIKLDNFRFFAWGFNALCRAKLSFAKFQRGILFNLKIWTFSKCVVLTFKSWILEKRQCFVIFYFQATYDCIISCLKIGYLSSAGMIIDLL